MTDEDEQLQRKSDLWFVYILENVTKTRLYTGATPDVARRCQQHNGMGDGGAKATRAGRPWVVVKVFGPYSKGDALRQEARVKKLSREAKLSLVKDGLVPQGHAAI